MPKIQKNALFRIIFPEGHSWGVSQWGPRGPAAFSGSNTCTPKHLIKDLSHKINLWNYSRCFWFVRFCCGSSSADAQTPNWYRFDLLAAGITTVYIMGQRRVFTVFWAANKYLYRIQTSPSNKKKQSGKQMALWIIWLVCFTTSRGTIIVRRTVSMQTREYFIYRGPGFLAIVWFGSSPTLSDDLDRRHTRRPRKRDNLLTGEGGRGRIKDWK
jgi:hypothetical protein